jgi:hypothetical protein
LELHGTRSVMIPEFQRVPGNDTLLAVISLLEARNYKLLNQRV